MRASMVPSMMREHAPRCKIVNTHAPVVEDHTMTPAVRAAQSAGIEFVLHRYEHDADADSFGLEAAEKLGVLPALLFKTLVAQVDGKQLVLALVPVAGRLDLKKLALLLHARKAELAAPA